MKQKEYDVVIVGGGPGGYTAALYAARSGFSVLVLEKLSPGGQMATTEQIDNYPGFEDGIDGYTLATKMKKGADRFGVETAFAQVEEMELTSNPKKLITSEGEVLGRTVILAMGASPRELDVPGEQEMRGHGVAYCAACDGMMYKNKTVVIAGGGNTAAADAILLSKICKEVHLVHRRDQLRASRIYIEPLNNSNIIFHWNTRITGVLHEKKVIGAKLEDVNTKEVSYLPCDGIFVAVGRVPDTAILKGQVTLDSHGYIQADETTRTNIPGVFAVGDIRTKPMRQIITAAADGAVASKYAEEFLSGM
ncbi:thioredoxin-disulfide reductase [Muricomes sp. OA1]|uniref:Thioredoxin reductase n=1 Tax=Hungatella hathewayi TaxID=154046 RepID=A0A3E2WWS7_9FIRM|nr:MULTISPECIES: thioredoxin-disulfide reductase [Clostridia]MEE0202927.1 thioredoxin-disulfide reductase [Muricomes sp.]MCH1972209.1 thioredoxin-disulfide reductase [Muricomes sp. OA1]MRM90676.1 thioredoxin-disulfide reductase [Faecalicatena contorta]MSC84276.1 thioredoxin-disulfide reductase [Eubacterium sp. BIOML-A1]MSD08418.1 thioredoxin-disulfide reductase [Eubacterium sp. BIOML-A2]